MYVPLTARDVLSVRLAQIRTDIGRRLSVVLQDMPRSGCDELIERIAQLQYASEKHVIFDAAAARQARRASGRLIVAN